MNTPCIGRCGRSVPYGAGGRCGACRLPEKRARSTAAWTARSREVRALGVCEGCGRTGQPLQAAHRVALHDGGDVLGAAIALCVECHARDTARERDERALRARR